MKITSLFPSTWNPAEALIKLTQGSSVQSSQGLSDLIILATIYLGSAFLAIGLVLTFRSCWQTIRYRNRLLGLKDYASVRVSLGSDEELPLFREFNHHLVDVPKQDGSDELVLRRSVDAAEIFTDARFAPGLSTNRIFQALPGILTGLGVLGTFIGLQLGIGGLDLQDLKKLETSIVPLIQGCAVAFSTSVWGVGVSLIFSLLEKIMEGFALGGVRKLQERVDALVPRYVPEEAMADLARSSRGSEDLLKGLAVAIGDEMQKAIGRLGAEIKDAVVNATREGQGPLAEQSAQLLSSAITAELGKLKDTIDGMAQRFSDDFGKVSTELTRQVESFGPTVASLAKSVSATQETVSNAVSKLNAHESVMSSMAEASDKIKAASELFASMNGTLESSAMRNKDAAEAQQAAANVNQEVATKFGVVGDRLPEVRQTIEDAARVIGSLGAPLKDLKDLIETLPAKQGEADSERARSEGQRNEKLLQLTNDLAAKVESAASKFAQAEGAAKLLQEASDRLEKASSNLGGFGQHVLQASQEQRAASEASRDAATASKKTTDMLQPLPAALTEVSSGLSLAGNSLRDGADSAATSYTKLIELQRLWLQGAETGLSALRDRLKEIIASYGSQIEGQTQNLMRQWTDNVTECLRSYETQVETLEGNLEELQDAISSLKRKP